MLLSDEDSNIITVKAENSQLELQGSQTQYVGL